MTRMTRMTAMTEPRKRAHRMSSSGRARGDKNDKNDKNDGSDGARKKGTQEPSAGVGQAAGRWMSISGAADEQQRGIDEHRRASSRRGPGGLGAASA